MAASPPDTQTLRAQLAPTLAALEQERQGQAQTCANAAKWTAGAALLGVIIAFIVGGGGPSLWLLAPIVLSLIVYIFISSGAKKYYSDSFKAFVMPELVKSFGELTFTGASGLSEADFNVSNLHSRPDRYNSEDLIEGRVGETRLRMSEVHAEREERHTDSKGHTTTSYSTIFRGLMMIADFNKNFAGITYVLPEGLSGSLGSFGRGLQSLGGAMGGRGDLVKLEDPEFERAFVVYSRDQIEARYLLSSSLMRRLLALKSQFDGEVCVAFIGGALYLTIAKRGDWFEPPALSTPLSFESVETTLRQLQMATGIVEDLDLNTRIWSKS